MHLIKNRHRKYTIEVHNSEYILKKMNSWANAYLTTIRMKKL